MFKCSALSQIWKKYILKLNPWDLSLSVTAPQNLSDEIQIVRCIFSCTKGSFWDILTKQNNISCVKQIPDKVTTSGPTGTIQVYPTLILSQVFVLASLLILTRLEGIPFSSFSRELTS